MGWKSKKDGTHFNDDKTYRDSSKTPDTEVNIEIDNNSDDFAEGVKRDFEGNVDESILDEPRGRFFSVLAKNGDHEFEKLVEAPNPEYIMNNKSEFFGNDIDIIGVNDSIYKNAKTYSQALKMMR